MGFSTLDIATFDDAAFDADFRAKFVAQVATGAGVESSDVVVDDIRSGSVSVESTVYFDATTGSTAAADTFVQTLQSDASSMFTQPSFGDYGDVTSSGVTRVTMPAPTAAPTTGPTDAPTMFPTPPTPIVRTFAPTTSLSPTASLVVVVAEADDAGSSSFSSGQVIIAAGVVGVSVLVCCCGLLVVKRKKYLRAVHFGFRSRYRINPGGPVPVPAPERAPLVSRAPVGGFDDMGG